MLVIYTGDPITPTSATTATSKSTRHSTDRASSTQPGKGDTGVRQYKYKLAQTSVIQ